LERSVSCWRTRSVADTHRRTSESQASPFSTITPLGEQKLISSLDNPALELLRLGIFEFPYYLATSVSADPLTVEIDVDVDVEASRGMDTQVRSWDGLAKSRRRCDWREERKDDLDVIRGRVLRRNVVREVGYRSIILRAFVYGVRDVVAMG
jgi:hypothetical protein